MSDQSADNNSSDHAEEPAKHMSSELVPAGAAHGESKDELPPDVPGSKEITLHRLTPHSSWDSAFGDTKPFDEKAFEEAIREPAAAAPESARRALPLAAMIAIAAVVGAISGGIATLGMTHFDDDHGAVTTAERSRAVDESMAKFNADLAAARTNLETAAKANSIKLAKLNEALKSSDITGSIAPPLPASVPSAPPMVAAPATQFARLPVVDGWVLREVADGGALVEGRMGTYEVFAGDPLPGVGRVDAIRRQDGRWVVVTTRGLIVAR